MSCENSVEKAVCVEAEITVMPKVEAGSVQVFCRDEPKVVDCSCMLPTYTFYISQKICLKIPVSVRAMAEVTGIGCTPQCEDRCYPDPCDFEDDE